MCVQERAHSPPRGERNFHVLYQLLAGADVSLLSEYTPASGSIPPLLRHSHVATRRSSAERLKLQRSWHHYRILGGGAEEAGAAVAAAAAQHDTDHFAHTTAALGALGLGADAAAVLRLLAFLLKLGNVHFEPQHNIDGSIGTRLLRPHGTHPPPRHPDASHSRTSSPVSYHTLQS